MFSLIAPSKAHSQQSHCLSTVHKNQSLLSLPPSHPIIINWGNKKHQTEALLLKHSQNNECFFYIIYIELESLLKINNVFRSGQIGRGTRFQLPPSVSVNTHEIKRTGPGLFFAWSGDKIYMRGKKSSDVPQKTRISITQWLLLHVTWPLSLLYQLESQYASANIFLAGGCHGSFTSPRWISHFCVEKDRTVMTQTRLCRSSPLMSDMNFRKRIHLWGKPSWLDLTDNLMTQYFSFDHFLMISGLEESLFYHLSILGIIVSQHNDLLNTSPLLIPAGVSLNLKCSDF